MPVFSETLRSAYVKIDEYLSTELEHRNPILLDVDDGEYPILLLEVDEDVAGFAVVDTNVQDVYPSAYKSFENMYAQHRSKWSTKNLSFVLCRADTDRDLDAFYRRIEGDMYFCQKFVIDVGEQGRGLAVETARLPFMPFRSQTGMGIGSVVPAKSLLVDNNVDTKLANFIVTAQKRSAAGILEDSLLGKFKRGPLEKLTQSSPEIQSRSNKKRVRISSLSISDFRAYRGMHTFDLDHDVVLMYGPNGLGKTSFFDAIDFFCTGRIGRLGTVNSKSDRFTKVTTHLDGDPENASVTASLRIDDESKTLVRLVSNRNNVTDGSDSLDRKGLLTLLTGISPKAKQARVEYLQRMFRATHYFGQGYQELLQDFRNDSTLSEDVVARMLVVEDYVEASKKLEAVCVQTERSISELTIRGHSILQEIKELDSRISDLKTENETDEQTSILVAPSIGRIEKNLRITLNIASEDKIDLDDSRNTKSYENMMHAESASLQSQLGELETLAARMGALANKSEELKISVKELAIVSTKISNLNKNLTAFQTNVNDQEKKIVDITGERSALEREVEMRRWLDSAQPEIKKHQKFIAKLEATLKDTKTDLASIEKNMTENNKDVLKSRNRLVDEKAILVKQTQKVKAILQLQGSLQNWAASLVQKQRLTDEIALADKNKIEESRNRDNARAALTEAEVTLATSKNELDSVESETASLSKLLSDAESMANSDECPVCGTHHGSQSALISLILSRQKHPTARAKEVSDRYSAAKRNIRSAKGALAKPTDKLKKIEIEQQSRTTRIDELEQTIEGFIKAAKSLELPTDVHNVPEIVRTEVADRKKKLESQKSTITNIEKAILNLSQNLQLLQSNKEQLDTRAGELQREIQTTRKNVGELEHSGQKLGLAGEEDIRKVRVRSLAEIDASMTSVNAILAKANRELTDANHKCANTGNQLSSLQKRHNMLEVTIASAKSEESGVFRRLRALGIKKRDFNIEGIGRREDEINLSITRYDELIGELRKLSIFLERSESTRASSALEAERASLQNQWELEVQKNLNLLTDWLLYFRSIKALIDNERQNAVRNYVARLGPLSSIMQERLRPVYGFGGIALHAVDGTIVTEVRYRNELVRPSDYFSDSQKQILMLSLFLAATITQSWSSFGPILLDDPVTHFDDLNAYSFAELLRSLVQQHEGDAQFMISTCEERIYHLLRQKFSRCPELDVTAYEFLSIGNRGPEYRQIPGDSGRISLVAG